MATIRVSGASKRGQYLLASARHNQGTDLRQVYGRWSDAKESAMKDCLRECREDDGTNFHITGHCSNYFSVAWEYTNQDTGEVMTKVRTYANTYIIDGSRPRKEDQ